VANVLLSRVFLRPSRRPSTETIMRIRFDLRWVMLLFLCLSVGLVIGIQPHKPPWQVSVADWQFRIARWDWYTALLATVSTACVVGLVEQIGALRLSLRQTDKTDSRQRFGIELAMLWRGAVALLLVTCVAGQLIVHHEFMQFAEREDVQFYGDLRHYLWLLCLMAAFSSTRVPQRVVRNRGWQFVLNLAPWLAGILLALIVLPDQLTITALVHIACNGVDTAQPLEFQRYPVHLREGYRFYWMAAAAATLFVANLAALTLMARFWSNRRVRYLLGTIVLLGTACTAGYTFWYFQFEFPRVSPDLAAGGNATLPREWLAGGVMLAFLTIVGARRLATQNEESKIAASTRSGPFYHLSPLWALFLTAPWIVFLVTLARDMSSTGGFTNLSSALETVAWYFTWLPVYFDLAVLAVAVRVLWTWFRHRDRLSEIAVQPTSRGRFAFFWTALLLVLLAGLPTVYAYCFAVWLGPSPGLPIPLPR